MMQDSKRIYFLDTLRAFIIFLVLVLHIVLVFLPWPVAGWVQSVAPEPTYLYPLTTIIDGPFLMVVMFFLAGYFTLGSLAKKGPKQFIKDKLIRIGIPWVVGGTIIASTLSTIAFYSKGAPEPNIVSVASFFQWLGSTFIFFKPEYYTQYHFWFLGVVLWFFILTALTFTIFKQKLSPAGVKPGKPSPIFWIGFVTLSTGASFAVSLTGIYNNWTNLYIISFQNIVLPVYIIYFILGMYAYKKNWFVDGYRPRIIPWTAIYLVSIMVHIILYGVTYQSNPTTIITKLIASITYNVTFISFLMMLLAVFQRFFNVGDSFQQKISQSSFSAYLIHLLVLFVVVIFTRSLRLPQPLVFLILIEIITLLSWGIGYALKITPGLRKVL